MILIHDCVQSFPFFKAVDGGVRFVRKPGNKNLSG